MSEVETGTRVEVYFNLHKLCLSYRPVGGRVSHTGAIWLENVTFSVQPAGRERVLREKRKNVHAFIRGSLVRADDDLAGPKGDGFVVVNYNPYRHGYFYRVDTGEPVHKAKEIIAIGKTIYARL